MIPLSFTMIFIGTVIGIVSLLIFSWAFSQGAFDQLNDQAMMVLDDADLRFERPWETQEQTLERFQRHGQNEEARNLSQGKLIIASCYGGQHLSYSHLSKVYLQGFQSLEAFLVR